MATTKERIAALRSKAVDLAKQADEMAAEETKRANDERRRAESASKIVLGAGVQRLPPDEQARTVGAILPRLSERDRGRMEKWIADGTVKLGDAPITVTLAPIPATDVQAVALLRTLGKFDVGGLSLISREFLSLADNEDRAMLEKLFAKLERSGHP